MPEEPKPRNYKQELSATVDWLGIIFRCHGCCMSPWIRRDFGSEHFGLYFVVAFLGMLFYAGNMNDVIVWCYAWLTLGMLAVRRVETLWRWKTKRPQHSQYIGTSYVSNRLLWFLGRLGDPVLCLIVGMALTPLSENLGKLWMLGFVSFGFMELMYMMIDNARKRARNDARIEMEASADRV